MKVSRRLQWSFLWLFFALKAFAGVQPALPMAHTLDLKSFSGKKTFLEAMLLPKSGIKANMDADFIQEYRVPTQKQVNVALENFDTKVVWKLLKGLAKKNEPEKSRSELEKVVVKLAEEKTFTPSNLDEKLKGKVPKSASPFSLASLFGMAAGAGTLVNINADNYYYNYGYEDGEVRSGRSYGASEAHKANDATDIFYLQELAKFLKSGKKKDISRFYETLIEVLTNCDVSGFSQLPSDAQAIATDFVAVYTAESYRHILEKLRNNKYPWENDLAEATFVANYNMLVDKIMMDGDFVEVDPKDGRPLSEAGRNRNDGEVEHVWWWKNNPETGRSGIGKTQGDRRALSEIISRYERKNHPDLSAAIEKYIGDAPDGDVYQGVMEYLNNANFLKKNADQSEIRKNSRALAKAIAAFLMQTREDAEEITKEVEKE